METPIKTNQRVNVRKSCGYSSCYFGDLKESGSVFRVYGTDIWFYNIHSVVIDGCVFNAVSLDHKMFSYFDSDRFVEVARENEVTISN